MKTNKFIKVIVVLMILFIASCGHEYKVKTIVYADGSCLRTLIVSSEKPINKFYEGDYPIPIDTTWNLEIEQDTSENGDTVFIHKASKFFESLEQVNQLYVKDTSEYRCIGRSVELKKRFRWFYTFFDYKETYPKLFDQPSLKTYLDSTQYNYAMLSSTEQKKFLEEHFDSLGAIQFDDRAEKGLNEWLEFTVINSGLEALEQSVENIENWQIQESEFKTKRDSLIELIDGELEMFENDNDIFEALKRVFNIDTVLYQELEKEKSFQMFVDRHAFWEDIIIGEEYTNSVTMPGLILETNSSNISDANEIEWNVDWLKYLTDNYEMKVTSRIVNVWTFWVSGGLIALLLTIMSIRFLIKRRK